MRCKICSGFAGELSQVVVLEKHRTSLYGCESCSFVFMEPIYWLEEAYANPITALDLGYVDRNIKAAEIISELLSPIEQNRYFVDYGGGTGLFVRLMRDRGFKFHILEPYTDPTFAKNCQADVDVFGRYEVLSAFEVFEHLPNPVESMKEMISFSSTIVFTTELCPDPGIDFNKWWYSGFEHGQHVSFYSEKSLTQLAARFDLKYKRLSSNWHLIAPGDHFLVNSQVQWGMPKWRRRLMRLSRKARKMFAKPKRRLSLLPRDYQVTKDALVGRAHKPFHLDRGLSEEEIR